MQEHHASLEESDSGIGILSRNSVVDEMMKTKLTPRVEIFINEYLVDLNVSRASRAAGYKHVCSGFRLLKKPIVANEINRRKQKRLTNLEISAERVLSEIARCAFFDPRKLYNRDGTLKKVTELDNDTVSAMQGLKVIERKKAGAVEKEYKSARPRALVLRCHSPLEHASLTNHQPQA
jgi:hypothetical protein